MYLFVSILLFDFTIHMRTWKKEVVPKFQMQRFPYRLVAQLPPPAKYWPCYFLAPNLKKPIQTIKKPN